MALSAQELSTKEVEIQGYVERNSAYLNLTEEEKAHIAKCLFRLWRWYKEDFPVGDFLQAVIRNDFDEAVMRADETNSKALILYVWYPHNEMPWDWRNKKKKEGKEESRG